MPMPQQAAHKPAAKPSAALQRGAGGAKGDPKGGVLQDKLHKANYRQGRDLVKPGQQGKPNVLQAGPKAPSQSHGALDASTRGMQQAQQATTTGNPLHSKLAAEAAKGDAAMQAQISKADKMHAATLTGVNTPASMGKGSMTLATGAAYGKTVHDGWSMTAQLRAEQQLAPDASREELLARAVTNDPAQGGTLLTTKHAEPAAKDGPALDPRYTPKQDNLTSPLTNVPPALQPKRKAIVVGNSDYIDKDPPANSSVLFTDLPGAKADAAAMAADLAQRGFDVEQRENLKAADLRKAMIGRGQGLKEGDELAIVYTGHGIGQGLNGVDSVMSKTTFAPTGVLPHTDLATEASKAVGGGYHLEMVIDACESDTLAREVRKELESGGARSLTSSVKDNGYRRLPTGKRFDALKNVLDDKGTGFDSLDALAAVLEKNSELANR